MTIFLIAGLWPTTKPAEAVLTALTEMGYPPSLDAAAATLCDALNHQLVGLIAAG